MNQKQLIEQAQEVMQKAYCKYSNFQVGAALLGKSGKVYTGCNVENASYGATICAERTAFVKAVSEGEQEFEAIAIVSSDEEFNYPCGVCRQFMSEFGLDLKIISTDNKNVEEATLREFLPKAFTEFNVNK